jgi:hypothetical protein
LQANGHITVVIKYFEAGFINGERNHVVDLMKVRRLLKMLEGEVGGRVVTIPKKGR